MNAPNKSIRATRCLGAAAGVFACGAVALAQDVLVDFGNDNSYRGVSVTNPDANGNHWNSVWSGAYYADMVDTAGNATTIDLGFSAAAGTDSYNGPAGATDVIQDPSLSVYNAAALGNLGADAAVFDFYVNSTFEIQGLDATKTYDLTFFGSHKYNNDNTTTYAVYSDNTYATLVDSGDLLVGVDGDHNQDTTLTLSGLSPQTFDILYVRFFGANGGDGYLNAMQITEVPAPSVLALLAIGGLSLGRRSRRGTA